MNYTTGFSANHVLYDWGKNAIAIEKTRLENALTQSQIETQEANLAYQITQLYYQYQLLQKSLAVQKNQQKRLNEQLSIIEQQVKSGTNLEYDQLSQQVRNQSHTVKIAEMEGQLFDLLDYLSTLYGNDASSLLKENSLAPDKKYLSAQSLTNNLDLQSFSAQEMLAKKETEFTKGGNLPSISGMASIGIRNGYVPRLNGETPAFADDFKLNSVLGIKLNIPIYSGKRTELQTQIAKINEERIQYQKIDTEKKLNYAERSARNNLSTILQRIEAQEKAVQQAQYALNLASERYKLGFIKKIELDQAENLLEEAQLNLVQFTYQAKKQEIDLRKIIGETFWK
jgi:outer membrane protein TolC